MLSGIVSGKFRWIFIAIVIAAACPVHAQQSETLASGLQKLMKSPGFENGHWGALVVDIETRQVIFQQNADLLFAPASVTKLFSSAAALEKLGPDYRFKTPVKHRGEIDKNCVLQGDLILIASGDMTMGGRTAPNGTMLFEDNDHTYGGDNAALVNADPLHALEELAREVAKSGIREIAGEVLVDDRLFPHAPSTGSGPRNVSPITINDNLVDIAISAGAKPGEKATWRLVPETSSLAIDFQVTTVEKDKPVSVYIYTVGPRSVLLKGTIPVGRKDLVRNFEIADPASWARSLFIEQLRENGVKVAASPLAMQDLSRLPAKSEMAKLQNVAEYVSPPLRENIKIILKVSHNLHASTLPLLLALTDGKSANSDGLRVQGRILSDLGVSKEAVSFGGGAGGSRADLVTPRAAVELLLAMRARHGFTAFYEALPILGRDGTLAKSVEANSPARGHVRAKTGTYYVEDDLTGRTILTSKALAGYIDTAHDRKLAYCIMVNNVPTRPSTEGKPPVNAIEAGKLLGRMSELIYKSLPEK